MDPLTALSIAGNVIQFVDFSFKLISGTRELYEDGQLTVRYQARKAIEDLYKFSTEMSTSIQSDGTTRTLTANEIELEKICSECSVLAQEMVDRLTTFEDSGGFERKRKEWLRDGIMPVLKEVEVLWSSVGQVLKSMWSAKDLDELEKNLKRYRESMNTRMLGSLRERVDQILRTQCGQTSEINDHTTRLVESTFRDMHTALSRDWQAQTRVLRNLIYNSGTIQLSDRQGNSDDDKSWFRSRAQVLENIVQRETKLQERAVEAVLESLRFPTITERYEAIAEAHNKTFEWIFQPMANEEDPNGVQWNDFVEWLREGQGIYWINGKAASGKSTLMKFIYNNPKTRENLLQWAGEKPLHIAKFFFWWAGTKIQKSQDGLLRSLLYEILRQMPQVSPLVLPSEYAMTFAREAFISESPHSYIWSTSSLSETFKALVSQNEMPMKLCLFIDGLDEYDGLEVHIARLFKELVLSPHVKVCISSRPHIPFEDAFFARPQLRLQDLTHKDLNMYVQDLLVHDEMMVSLATREPMQCQKLVREIVDEAQGVFLWVVLVVRALINGLSKHDRVPELQRRLQALPKDLNQLYEHMILKVDDIYKEEASRLFQLVDKASEELGDWRPAELLSVYTLYLANKQSIDLTHELKQSRATEQEVLQRCKRLDIALKARCGGLLEIQYGKLKAEAPRPLMKVAYLHRTVRDFILTGENWEALLKGAIGGPTKEVLNPNVAILKSMILQIKDCEDSTAHRLIDHSFTFIHRIKNDKSVPIPEFEELFDTFSSVAVASRYVDLPASHRTPTEVEHLMRLLQKHGRNPNEPLNGASAWQSALSYVASNCDTASISARLPLGLVIQGFLENGADPDAHCKGPRGERCSASEVIAKTFRDVRSSSPANSYYLERLRVQGVGYEDSTTKLLNAQACSSRAVSASGTTQAFKAKKKRQQRWGIFGKLRNNLFDKD